MLTKQKIQLNPIETPIVYCNQWFIVVSPLKLASMHNINLIIFSVCARRRVHGKLFHWLIESLEIQADLHQSNGCTHSLLGSSSISSIERYETATVCKNWLPLLSINCSKLSQCDLKFTYKLQILYILGLWETAPIPLKHLDINSRSAFSTVVHTLGAKCDCFFLCETAVIQPYHFNTLFTSNSTATLLSCGFFLLFSLVNW